jgi:hypothetical protein
MAGTMTKLMIDATLMLDAAIEIENGVTGAACKNLSDGLRWLADDPSPSAEMALFSDTAQAVIARIAPKATRLDEVPALLRSFATAVAAGDVEAKDALLDIHRHLLAAS